MQFMFARFLVVRLKLQLYCFHKWTFWLIRLKYIATHLYESELFESYEYLPYCTYDITNFLASLTLTYIEVWFMYHIQVYFLSPVAAPLTKWPTLTQWKANLTSAVNITFTWRLKAALWSRWKKANSKSFPQRSGWTMCRWSWRRHWPFRVIRLICR